VIQSVLSYAVLLALPTTLAAQSQRQSSGASSLEGVWKLVERTVTGAGARTETNPPGLFIATRGYYSSQWVGGTTSRKASAPPQDAAKLTDAEKISRFEQWDRFGSNAGTYHVSGSTLTTRPLIAKNQSVMEGESFSRKFTMKGDTLWWDEKTATNETRWKFVRIE
jgi:hypothetical protein